MPTRSPNPNEQPVELNRTSLFLGLLLVLSWVYCSLVISLTNNERLLLISMDIISPVVGKLIDQKRTEDKKLCLEVEESPVGRSRGCRFGCNSRRGTFFYGSYTHLGSSL
jgi:photosystem II PsbL protein